MSDTTPTRGLLPTLVLISALGEMSTQMLIPSLAAIEGSLGGGQGSLHLALSAFVATFALGQLVFGPVSDRVGRRPVLIAGLLLFLGATASLLFVESVPGFVAARAVQGLGACAAFVLARAVARDVWGANAASALSLVMFGILLSVALTPVVGGTAAALFGGWQAAVVLTLVLGALALAAVLVLVGETNASRGTASLAPRAIAATYLDLLRDSGFRGFALSLGFTYGAMFAFIAGSSYVFIGELGLSPTSYGLVFGVIVLGLVAGTLVTRRLAPRIGPARVVRLGTRLVAAGAVGTLAMHHIPGLEVIGLALPQVVLTFGGGLVMPAAVAGAVMPNGHRAGAAAGMMGFAQMAGATAAGLALAQLPGGGTAMLGLQTVLALLAFAAMAAVSRPAAQSEASRA
jgi:DHA1 family bicyclomycin/chloramphenicol resistance-like MFS transporter